MSGLLQRLTRRRPRAADTPPPGDPQPLSTAADPASDDAAHHLPAGTDPASAPSATPGFRERGRLRRRLRYLRRLRELQLRDLGGLVFDVHRFAENASADARGRHAALVEGKVAELDVVDRELRALERALDDRRPVHELREAGIGGACGHCGALHASDARFCSSCGAPVAAGVEPAPAEAPADPVTVADGDGARHAGAARDDARR